MKRYSAHSLVTESPLLDEFVFVENESGRYYRLDDVQKALAKKDLEIAELRKDARRIDWLARNSKTCTVYGNGTARFFPNNRAAHLYGATYREAIDVAIAAEDKPSE